MCLPAAAIIGLTEAMVTLRVLAMGTLALLVVAIVMPFCLSDNRRLLSYFKKLNVDSHDIPFKFTRYYKSTTTYEMMIDIKAFYINT